MKKTIFSLEGELTEETRSLKMRTNVSGKPSELAMMIYTAMVNDENIRKLIQMAYKAYEDLGDSGLKKMSEHNVTDFTPEDVKKFEAAYKKALAEKKEKFDFNGHEFLTAFAKYALKYLTKQVKK